MDLSPTVVTSRVLKGTMNNLVKGIRFTLESKIDFDGTWLPTLDMSLAITSSSRVIFKYYEKEVSANAVIHQKTALGENQKMQILSNEMFRRMMNTSDKVDMNTKLEVVDNMAMKMLTSGYSLMQTRRAISNGLRYYEAKKERCKKEKKPLYRTAKMSQGGRYRKKLMAKTTWYRKKKIGNPSLAQISQGRGQKRKREGVKNQEIETKSVIFVENTPGGEFAKQLRSLMERIHHHLGCNIKVVERSGTKIKDLFPLTNLWEGSKCGREDCYPCSQGTEELPNCKRRNIIYESICSECNPGATKKGSLKKYDGSKPSLYVGETARSLQERSKEHLASFEARSQKSHIYKHQEQCHGGSREQKFIFKIVGAPKSALNRQVGEAIRIRNRGGEGAILNARGEYNRCSITRLTLGSNEEKPELQKRDEGEGEQAEDWINNQGAEWILQKSKKRELNDREATKGLGKVSKILEVDKRKGEDDPPSQEKGRLKKRKFKQAGLGVPHSRFKLS